jgi:hypothetical protein
MMNGLASTNQRADDTIQPGSLCFINCNTGSRLGEDGSILLMGSCGSIESLLKNTGCQLVTAVANIGWFE